MRSSDGVLWKKIWRTRSFSHISIQVHKITITISGLAKASSQLHPPPSQYAKGDGIVGGTPPYIPAITVDHVIRAVTGQTDWLFHKSVSALAATPFFVVSHLIRTWRGAKMIDVVEIGCYFYAERWLIIVSVLLLFFSLFNGMAGGTHKKIVESNGPRRYVCATSGENPLRPT